MGRYFRVVFRSRCIQMTMGVNLVSDLDFEQIYFAHGQIQSHQQELDQQTIDAALVSLTKRQRQVAEWILNQKTPVSVTLISQHFGITTRGVRKLINNAIIRIENGHRRVCQTVVAVS